MEIGVVGAGVVGLTVGACFAGEGHRVRCYDRDDQWIAALQQDPHRCVERELADLLADQLARESLSLHSISEALSSSEIVFIAVDTPGLPDGWVDLSSLWEAVETVMANSQEPIANREERGGLQSNPRIMVVKSTVPVGTCDAVQERLRSTPDAPRSMRVEVAANPEFLRAGSAVADFTRPDRVVIGTRSPEVATELRELYRPFAPRDRQVLVMDPRSAEMAKYAANAFLATKVSFITEMAALCDALGADVEMVRQALGADTRIAPSHLRPGIGFGGPYLPKDLRALTHQARTSGAPVPLLDAVERINRRQREQFLERILAHFGGVVAGKTLAIWGLTYKPATADIRESPALEIAKALAERGARLRICDPGLGAERPVSAPAESVFIADPMEAADGADALLALTGWEIFRKPDFADLRRRMAQPVIFDGRNLYDPAKLEALGFRHYAFGRGKGRLKSAQW